MHMYLYMICPHRFVLTILHTVGKGVTPSNDEKEDVSLSGGQPKNNKGKVDETLIANTKYSQKPSDSYSNEDSHTTKEKTNDSLKRGKVAKGGETFNLFGTEMNGLIQDSNSVRLQFQLCEMLKNKHLQVPGATKEGLANLRTNCEISEEKGIFNDIKKASKTESQYYTQVSKKKTSCYSCIISLVYCFGWGWAMVTRPVEEGIPF